MPATTTIRQAIQAFLDSVTLARSQNTARSYQNAMQAFITLLDERHNASPTKKSKKLGESLNPQKEQAAWTETTDITQLDEDAIAWFAQHLKVYSPATEQLYLTAAAGFFEYISAERLSAPNLPRMRLLIHQRARKPGQRLPQFPRDQIEQVIEYAINLANNSPALPQEVDPAQPEAESGFGEADGRNKMRIDPTGENMAEQTPPPPRRRGRPRKNGLAPAAGHLPGEAESERLIRLRDRAFILTLADTGLRVHEACKLRRGDVDWNEGRALLIGKGDREAVVRFSQRSLAALKDYLAARARLDGSSGRPLQSLPLFARHDRGAGKKVKPVTTTTGRNIIDQRCKEALGAEDSGNITPHSFRHYFVTTVLRGSGGNLKMAQELARHKNISVTQRYAHLSDDELDQGYSQIFDE